MTTRRRRLTLLVAILVPGVTAATTLSWFRRPVPARPPTAAHGSGGCAALNRLDLRDLQTLDPSQRSDRILLITLDTLRADHLSCYGYPRRTTPFIDSIAAEGVRFTRAFAPMATTAPSHASMFTGLYPLQHGVLKNGNRLSDDVGTLPEILASAGFETAGFVSTNRHFAAGNIHQGFRHFDEPAPEGLELQYRPAEQTLAEAQAWLAQTPPPQRLFLWIHLFDPHEPYVERPAHLDAATAGDNEAVAAWLDFVRQEHHVDLRPGRGHADGHADDRLCYDLYDAEIHYLDACLKAFFDQTAALGFEDFLTIIVADHGEGLRVHGWWGHGKDIYNEQVRIPLILRWPDRRFASRTVSTVVEANDLMPTILHAAGVDRRTIAEHRALPIEGTPLQGLLAGGAEAGAFGHAFIQRRQFSDVSRASWQYEDGAKYALVDADWKYIYRTTGTDELYHLATDFYEQQNLIDSDPAALRDLQPTLLDLISGLESSSGLGGELVDEQTIRQLRSLGYVQ
ncbi:MAG: sulfatase [Planctomycetota bacterium]|jgi:arylsulfatase A-like enzyme